MAVEHIVRGLRIWSQNWVTYTVASFVYITLVSALFINLNAIASFLPSEGLWNFVNLPLRAVLVLAFVAFGSILSVSAIKMTFVELESYAYLDWIFSGLDKWKEAVSAHLAAAVACGLVGGAVFLLGQLVLAGLGMLGVVSKEAVTAVNLLALVFALAAAVALSFVGQIVALEETNWMNPLPTLRKSFDFVRSNKIDSLFLFVDIGIVLALASIDLRALFVISVVTLPTLVMAATAFYVDCTGAGLHPASEQPAETPEEPKQLKEETKS